MGFGRASNQDRRAAREVREHGTWRFAGEALSYAEANGFMGG